MTATRTWTLPTLRDAIRRQHEGETVAAIAADLGCTEAALRSALQRHVAGAGPGRGVGGGGRLSRERARIYRRAILLRREGRTWPAIREALDVECSAASLAGGVLRYADRVGFDLRVPRAPDLVVDRRVTRGQCRILDCERPAAAYRRGLCAGCYLRAHQAGRLNELGAPDRRFEGRSDARA